MPERHYTYTYSEIMSDALQIALALRVLRRLLTLHGDDEATESFYCICGKASCEVRQIIKEETLHG